MAIGSFYSSQSYDPPSRDGLYILLFAIIHPSNIDVVRMVSTYSYLLSYILLTSMLSGVLVGVAETLYLSFMGYEGYIAGLIGRIEQMQQMYVDMGVAASDMAIFEQFTTQLRYTEQPSMLLTVFNQLQVYAMMGCIPGFIIASVNSRRLRRMREQK